MEQHRGLLPNTAVMSRDGVREYHIDSHPDFLQIEPQLSWRKDPNVRPKIIFGQDETVMKEHTYSNKCWHDPTGATELLPKSDGIAKMIPALVSRVSGLGVELTAEELAEVNSNRTDENSI